MSNILVKLGLSTSQFDKGLSKSQRRTKKFAAGVSKAFISIVGPLLAISALKALGSAALKLGDDIDRATQKTGTSTEEFQKLGYAARQSKAGIDTLERGLEGMNQRLGKTPEKFEEYGIAVRNADGTMKSSAEVFSLVAERVKNAGTQAEATAIAQDLLGRAGRDLLPTLLLGADGLEEMGNKAKELGQVMSEDTIKALGEATQAIDDFKTASTVAFAEALMGAKDLYKFLQGEGLNDQHQAAKDVEKRARAQLKNEGVIETDKLGRHTITGAGFFDGDSRDKAKEAIEIRMGELQREALIAGMEEQKVQDEITIEKEKQAKITADNLETESRSNEAAARGLTIAERHAQVMKARAFEELPAAERLLKYEEELAALNATDDSLLSDKERERIVKEILRLEDKILDIRQQQDETIPEEEEEDGKQMTRDFFGKEFDVDELRRTMAEDMDGKTVAGRQAKELLVKGGYLDRSGKEAKEQLDELKKLNKTLTGKFANQ